MEKKRKIYTHIYLYYKEKGRERKRDGKGLGAYKNSIP